MSTKATRTTLQIVTERLEDSLAEEGLSRAQRESYEHQLSLAREALAEVEAIEALARTLTQDEDCTPLHHDSRKREAALLERIAKEAP